MKLGDRVRDALFDRESPEDKQKRAQRENEIAKLKLQKANLQYAILKVDEKIAKLENGS